MIRCFESERGRTRTPILAMTAHAQPKDRERCLAAGMDDHLPKPLTTDAFRSALTRWLGAGFLAEPEHLPAALTGESSFEGSPQSSSEGSFESLPQASSESLPQASSENSPQGSQPESHQPQRFDASGLLRRAADDQALVRRVLAGFLEDIPKQLLQLERSVALADREGVKRHAHTIRGAAATVGGLVLAAEAMALEDLVPDASLLQLAARARSVAQEFSLLRDTLRASCLAPSSTGSFHEDTHR
jgi:HPt (histidine-containing phosphotransfer) domain-containing protein